MAGISNTYYQPVINILVAYLESVNEYTNENQERLSTLSEVSDLAASIQGEEEEGDVEETSIVGQCKALIKDIFETLLFGPYTIIVTQLSDFFSIVNDMENRQKAEESFKLPNAMQGRVVAVHQYLEKAKGRLKEIDDTLRDLIPKIKKASIDEFRVSAREMNALKSDAEDVKLALEACKKYLDSAEKEFNLLESDINSEITTYQMRTVAKVTTVAAGFMIAEVLFGPKEILQLSPTELAQKIASSGTAGGLAVGATVAGMTSLILQLACIIRDSKTLLRSHLDSLRTELEKVKTDFEVTKSDIDGKVTGRME